MLISTSIHFPANVFLCSRIKLHFVCVYASCFLYPLICWRTSRLVLFFLTIMNSAAMNKYVHLSLGYIDLQFVACKTMNGIARSHDCSNFHFFEDPPTLISTLAITFVFLPSITKWFSFSAFLPAFLVIWFLGDICSSWGNEPSFSFLLI